MQLTNTNILRFNYRKVAFEVELSADERIISENLRAHGVWENNQLDLYPQLLSDTGVFVDIGANVGVNSIFASLLKPNARVISVEPSSVNFRLLQKNVERAAAAGIETFNLAIADFRGMIGFEGEGTNAHLNLGAGSGETSVPCETLDEFILSCRVDEIDLIKIDVEGFTDVVLSGGDRALSIARSAIIEFSIGDIMMRTGVDPAASQSLSVALDHAEQCFTKLRQNFEYFYYISRRDGLVKLDRTCDLFDLMQSEASVGDVLATKFEEKSSISGLAFAMRAVLELKRQNHFRIIELATLREER
jgi:FkbM family methyltransferase